MSEKNEEEIEEKIKPREKVGRYLGPMYRYEMACGNSLYITVHPVPGTEEVIETEEANPFQTFANLGKAGGCTHSNVEALSRIVSVSLRCNVDPEAIIDQLQGIRCPSSPEAKEKTPVSCADAFAWSLKLFLGRDPTENPMEKMFNNEKYNEEKTTTEKE